MSKEKPFRLGFLVHDVSRLRRTVIDKEFRPLHVTRSQWWVLANLSRHDSQGMIQTELAEVMDVGKVTLGGLIDRLQANGLVERRADPKDRRVKRIHMTSKGKNLLAKLQKNAKVVNDEITSDLSEKEIEQVENALFKIKQRLLERLNTEDL